MILDTKEANEAMEAVRERIRGFSKDPDKYRVSITVREAQALLAAGERYVEYCKQPGLAPFVERALGAEEKLREQIRITEGLVEAANETNAKLIAASDLAEMYAENAANTASVVERAAKQLADAQARVTGLEAELDSATTRGRELVEAAELETVAEKRRADELAADRDRLARYIITVVRPREAIDHTCAKCVPNGEPIDGFVCGYHLAAEIVGGT